MIKIYVADFYCPCGMLDESYGNGDTLEEVKEIYDNVIASHGGVDTATSLFTYEYSKAVLRDVISGEIIACWENEDNLTCKDCRHYNGFFCNCM